ncbi:MAG: F0F1 ATP synthase subunit gamma [Porticoccaceae bacterium]|nr:F0F1 ATP synthase subunit gamma [Porticoccaceae bacterium]
MSRRRELEQHRRRLDETREIMNSMKALAFMETHKLEGFLDAQRAVVAHIQTVAEDFFSFYPDALPRAIEPTQVYLLLGSERGFCGDFNQALLKTLSAQANNTASNPARIIAVGGKLSALLENSPETTLLEGASVLEDVENILVQIIDTLSQLQTQNGDISLTIIHHDPAEDTVLSAQVMPPFASLHGTAPQFSHPPQLNLKAETFCIELIDRYLFSTLFEILYLSLIAENQRRVSHLEHAVQQLDDKSAALLRRGNTLRQEEITEEIEVILLSTSNLY